MRKLTKDEILSAKYGGMQTWAENGIGRTFDIRLLSHQKF